METKKTMRAEHSGSSSIEAEAVGRETWGGGVVTVPAVELFHAAAESV